MADAEEADVEEPEDTGDSADTSAADVSAADALSDAAVSREPVVSEGLATSLGDVASCGGGRDSAYGTLTVDGQTFFVPAERSEGATCVDIFNECEGGENDSLAQDLEDAAVQVEEGGETITAYIFGDNYFELYVNGEYVCRDAETFTPFNSHAIQFEATYPLTIGILGVDWEEPAGVGVGLESGRGGVQTGDAGMIARFLTPEGEEIAVTDADWKCTPVYISPLDEEDVPCATDGDSRECTDDATCYADGDYSDCFAVHFATDPQWNTQGFDDSSWQDATTYEASDVTGQAAFVDYAERYYQGATFIWSSNLDLDNRVLCRVTINEAP